MNRFFHLQGYKAGPKIDQASNQSKTWSNGPGAICSCREDIVHPISLFWAEREAASSWFFLIREGSPF
jgi:hypothetical protein